MPLYRTPLVDFATPIVFLSGRNAGCVTPYFQRTLMSISQGADEGTAVAPDVTNKVDKGISAGWVAASGSQAKSAWTTYTAPTISASPTQAEVQAIADHLQIVSRRLAAVISGNLASQHFVS